MIIKLIITYNLTYSILVQTNEEHWHPSNSLAMKDCPLYNPQLVNESPNYWTA